MNALMLPGVTEVWVAMGTKFGKTIGTASGMCAALPIKQQALYRWIAPIYKQSEIGYNYIRRMLPGKPWVDAKDGGPSIYIPSRDNRLQFFHGQNPESIEGEATAGNVLDEAAKMKETVYAAVKTTTSVTKGPIVLISTPFGKNWFYRGCMKAKEEMLRARKEGRRPRFIFMTAPSLANPAVDPQIVEDARRGLPDRLFRQYYLAEFVDEGAVFGFLFEAFGSTYEYTVNDTWYANFHGSQAVYVGADWAKTNDYTVFYALNEKGQNVAYKRMNKVSYPNQVAALYSFMQAIKDKCNYPGVHIECLHDRTGVGEPIDDMINDTNNDGWDIEGITWNNSNKEAGVTDLILSLDEQALLLHPWHTLKFEMENFEVNQTLSGRFQYKAAEGQHDDTVMALIQANMLYRQNRYSTTSVGIVDEINNVVQKIRLSGGALSIDDID